MSITKQQIIALNTALHRKNLMHRKAEIVEAITQGRATSSKDLTFEEAHALLLDLNKADKEKVDHGKKMRGNIIAMAHEIGFIKEQTVVSEKGMVKKNDYSHLDNWMLKFSYLKKKLFDYKYEELPTLVTQFKNVYSSTLKNK